MKKAVLMTKRKALNQLYLLAMNNATTVAREKYLSMALISALAPEVLNDKQMWTALITEYCNERPQCFIDYYLNCDELFSNKRVHGNLRKVSADGTITIEMCFFHKGIFDKWQTIAKGVG